MIEKALFELCPGCGFTILDDDYDTIWWNPDNPLPLPAKNIVDAKIVELRADYTAKQYQRDRAKAYPSLQAQLDMQYWDSVNGTTTWADAVAAVKAQFPKPE